MEAGRDLDPDDEGARRGCMASEANPEEQTVEAGAVAASSARPLTWRDIRGPILRHADQLVSAEAEAAALRALRAATGETAGGMERHTMRQHLIAERMADTRGIAYDRELLLCASFLHDSGLYGPASSGDVYIKDSGRYARRTLEPLGWSEERLRTCVDACEQHHAFTARWGLPNEVELVRRSDLVEVLPELVRFGIPRSWLKRELWHAVPRAGFWAATLDVVRAHWRRMLPECSARRGPDRHRPPGSDDAAGAAVTSDHAGAPLPPRWKTGRASRAARAPCRRVSGSVGQRRPGCGYLPLISDGTV